MYYETISLFYSAVIGHISSEEIFVQRLKRILLILLVISACAGCDQSTKSIASYHLEYNSVLPYAGDMFRLHYIENHGAFLGIGDSLPDKQRFLVFTLLVALILGIILVYTIFNTALSTFSVVAYSIIMGGGFSNLYDRIVNNGGVVDFLNMGIGQLRTGIFNVADVFIMVGIVMLMTHVQILKQKRNKF